MFGGAGVSSRVVPCGVVLRDVTNALLGWLCLAGFEWRHSL